MKYKDSLNQEATAKDAENNELLTETANLALQAEILDIKKSISNVKGILNARKTSKNYNPKEILQAYNSLQAKERELAYFTELLKEQF